MPGFDGTGPLGLGPMTGGGRGFCALPLTGYPGWGTYGRFWPRWGGRGWRHWYYATGLPGWYRARVGLPAWGGYWYGRYPGFVPGAELTPDAEAAFLRQQLSAMEQEMKEIQQRLADLDAVISKKKQQEG
ncbi:MAG TPA: DUF5320 domain-containing protein [bacterium]|nr:DUF5320 domain-containing protein [bacterium]